MSCPGTKWDGRRDVGRVQQKSFVCQNDDTLHGKIAPWKTKVKRPHILFAYVGSLILCTFTVV